MKRNILLIITPALTLSLAACTTPEPTDAPVANEPALAEAAEEGSAAPAPAPEAEPASQPTSQPTDEHAGHADEGSADSAAHMHGSMEHVLEEGAYDPAELVMQPGAEMGNIARCPVSGEVFTITEDAPFLEHEGQNVYFCCPGCIRRFQRDPERWLATQAQ